MLTNEVDEFLIDRQSRNVSPKTLLWYTHALSMWRNFTLDLGIAATQQVTATSIRRFMLHLTERGHNAGGVSNIYRAVRAYLRWYGNESAPPGWPNPIAKVKGPKLTQEPLQPVPLEHVRAMLATCTRTETGARDRAILLLLLDTGIRHAELAQLTVGDVDLDAGTVLIRCGKGRKFRTVFIGNRTRRALVTYLRRRRRMDTDTPLWLGRDDRPLRKAGLRQVIRRRAEQAGIPVPGLHDFRRAFAVNCLRAGMDLVTLQRLMGHSTLAIIQRYLALIDDDLRAAHQRFGAVDNLLWVCPKI